MLTASEPSGKRRIKNCGWVASGIVIFIKAKCAHGNKNTNGRHENQMKICESFTPCLPGPAFWLDLMTKSLAVFGRAVSVVVEVRC